jgi:hypothetical protein
MMVNTKRALLRIALATCGVAFTLMTSAQRGAYWNDVVEVRQMQGAERRILPEEYRTCAIDIAMLRSQLPAPRAIGTELRLPRPDGASERFRIWPNTVMHPELAARYPDIRTFAGVSLDRPHVQVRLDLTMHGFHAMVMDDRDGWWFIDPHSFGDPGHIIVYRKDRFRKQGPGAMMTCGYDAVNDLEAAATLSRGWMQEMGEDRVGDCQLRTYRLALACTGEYANFHGSNTTNNNKGPALGAMVTSMNRVNGIYERDATLTMVLVPNTDALIYLSASSDPYSNTNGSAMLGQNQTACDGVIGSANYDIGHVFSTGGGGVAYLNSPCNNNLKAGGVTGRGSPVGDPFDVDYVAHEMGHQFGGNHTQNNNCNRASAAAFEPGSASTIMGYAGICSPNVQNNSDAYFLGYSMQEMAANITVGTSSTCPVVSPSGNIAPTVSAGPDRTIPRSTPFLLTASGSDANAGNTLSYCWEQMNNQVSTQPPVATSTSGPNFRSLSPTAGPERYVPALSAVVAGTTPTWEVLASVGRTYNFRVTVRDNAPGAGCNDQDDMVVTVSGTAGPFVVTQPNTALTWNAGGTHTVTWNVASTNVAPVGTVNVDILLSVDGGFTYPFTLLTGTPNDGSQSVTLPLIPATTTARIMVRANGNIFYDISNTNFSIAAASLPDYTVAVDPQSATACRPAGADYTVQTTSVLGYSQPITCAVSGLPAGLSSSFSTNPVTPGAVTLLTLGSTASVAPGTYPFTLNTTSASGNRSIPLQLVVSDVPDEVTLSAPADGAVDVAPGGELSWSADPEATGYTVTIASDPAMVNVVEEVSGVTGTAFSPAIANAPNSTYYWRVSASNACGAAPPSPVRSFTTASCFPIVVNITIDRYGNETTWQLLSGSTVIASGGPYAQLAGNGTQVQPAVNLCVPAGCYELRVFDSFGDGNCCAYGAGIIEVEDGFGQQLAFVSQDINVGAPAVRNFCVPVLLPLQASVWLDGAYVAADGLMRDALRSSGLLPTTEPYSDLGYPALGGGGEQVLEGVFGVSGDNAVVDWVRVELRQSNDPSTVVAVRHGLLQRDGDIVDMDGSSLLGFAVAPGAYRVAVRHRNHFGCMGASNVTLGEAAAVLDLRSAATAAFGTNARRVSGASAFLWAGNVLPDDAIKYSGPANDRDPILSAIGGSVPTASVTGYLPADVNLDGAVKYVGPGNDRDPILLSIGGSVPTAIIIEQLP